MQENTNPHISYNESTNSQYVSFDQNLHPQYFSYTQPSQYNQDIQSINIDTTINSKNEFYLLLNILFLICGFIFFPFWFLGICFLTSSNKTISLLAKINTCLFLIPLILIFLTIIIFIIGFAFIGILYIFDLITTNPSDYL